MNSKPTIHVQMFGNFSVTVHNQAVALIDGRHSKIMLALQVLLYYYPNPVSRSMLLEILCSDKESADPAAKLRVIIFRLNRFIKSTSLRNFFQIAGTSSSRWLKCSASISIDVHEFQQLYSLAFETDDPHQRLAMLQKAEALYQDDFLRFSDSNSWSQSILASTQQQYITCVETLIHMLSKEKKWNELYPIVTKSCRIHPLEHFYCAAIDCLIGQAQYQEARQFYQNAIHILRDELFVKPSAILTNYSSQIDQLLLEDHETIYDLQLRLREPERIRGPYNCNPSSFIDVFRMVCRMAERSDFDSYLMIYRFTDFQGHSIYDPGKINCASNCLRMAIQNCLRRGDAFTQFRTGEFVVLLTNTCTNGCTIVDKRISAYYYSHSVRGVHLRCVEQRISSPSIYK